jgi:2-polyprenyl-3-methyl-5-hydroxy-6-metoxy-1,4-benzoquinol methylase
MNHYDKDLDVRLLRAVPDDARLVLDLECAGGHLGRKYKESHPEATWIGVEANPAAAQTASQFLDHVHLTDVERDALPNIGTGYDTVVMGDLLARVREPDQLLASLYELTAPNARIVCRLPNMGHISVLERLIGGDISFDAAGLLDKSYLRFYSPSSASKLFLDAGWLPHMSDAIRSNVEDNEVVRHMLGAAKYMGVPQQTAIQNLTLHEMILVCQKAPVKDVKSSSNSKRFSVIVPVNRPWQYELNIARSPGLAEVAAEIIIVNNAKTASQAYDEGAKRASHPWRIMAHQDVYFPAGSGHAIAELLGAQEVKGSLPSVMGFAGLHADSEISLGLRKAGLVVDRTQLFTEPASERAVSLDEFAIVLHRDSPLRIDPELGWHLWATDLCLQALSVTSLPPPSVVRVPIFHNSTTSYELPDEIYQSAVVLRRKYPHLGAISSLCGTIQ